jgi:chromosome partitioning protein
MICTADSPGLLEAKLARSGATRGRNQVTSPHFIVFANEKGGTGKSTTAVHHRRRAGRAATGAASTSITPAHTTRYLENRPPPSAGSAPTPAAAFGLEDQSEKR